MVKKQFTEVLTRKDMDRIRSRRAKSILRQQGLLFIPRKSKKQTLRELGSALKKAGEQAIKEEGELEKQLKKL